MAGKIKTVLLKYQRAQFPRKGTMLLYNEDRSIMTEQPIDKLHDKLFDTYGEKFYANVEINKAKKAIHLDEAQILPKATYGNLGW